MERFRAFLSRNKVIFETLTAALLSLMAVAVGITQLQIADEQTQLQRAAQSPTFAVAEVYVWSDELESYTDTWLNVHSIGAVARNIDARTAVFIEISLSISGTNRVTFSQPIQGYYFERHPQGNLHGHIFRFRSDNNNLAYSRIENAFYDALNNDTTMLGGSMHLRKYVKISCQDMTGSSSVRYFKVTSGVGGESIGLEQGDSLFDTFLRASPFVDISDADAKQLIEMAIRSAQ